MRRQNFSVAVVSVNVGGNFSVAIISVNGGKFVSGARKIFLPRNKFLL
ncbi:MAG: hypothetical protein SR1Q7_12050 [Quinella sp. 1Q7]|nr:hypothetical protein [Quinella sp. 1Q7]